MLNIDDRLIREVSPKIRPNALSVLLAIAIHLNKKTGRCFPSHDTIMRLTGLGRDAVYTALDVLRDNGLLVSSQPIDSKTKQFGRRTFRLTTRFIKIFVDAEDADPLPENPYTENPDTADPYTENQQTYQLNNPKRLNKNKQIKEEEKDASRFSSPSSKNISLEAEKKEKGLQTPAPLEPPFIRVGEIAVPDAMVKMYDPKEQGLMIVEPVTFDYPNTQHAPTEFRRVNIPDEIEALKTDEAAKETFAIGRKIPAKFYDEFLEAFRVDIAGRSEAYNNRPEFRNHFFNWCGRRYERKQREALTPKRSHLNGAGGDVSKYLEPQKF